MTRTKSQKARAAARKGAQGQQVTSSDKVSRSAPKSRNTKSKKLNKKGSIPAVLPDLVPKIGIKGMDSITVEVTQWLTTVQTGIQTRSNILQSFYLNPQSFLTAGRLSKLAQLYEKYYFESFEASYHPNVAVTNQGSIFLALDMDPEDTLTTQTGTTLMNSVAAFGQKRFAMGPVYQPFKVEASGKADFSQILYVDPDRDGDRMAYAGRLVIGNVSSFPTDLEAGFVTIKARIKFLVPSLETAGAGSGSMNSWRITNPTHLIPWGTGVTPSQRNNLQAQVLTETPAGDPHSCILFGTAGVFLVVWYSTGSALGSGNVTFGGGATQTNAGDLINTPYIHVAAAATETFGSYVVNVPDGSGWMSFTQTGTHGTSNLQFIRVILTPYPLQNANPLALMVSSLQERLNGLTMDLFRLKSDRPYQSIRSKQPAVPGETWETQTSSSSSSTIESFNTQPSMVETSGSSSSMTEQISLIPREVPGGRNQTDPPWRKG